MMMMKRIQDQYHKEMTEASNNSFNLAVSSCLIAARDMGMSVAEVKEFLQRTFGILDDVVDDLTRIEEMLRLVNSWGIEIYDTAQKRTVTSGAVIEKKTAVFYLLQQGITEIEDILTKCKLHNIDIDYRDACAYRWEFNKVKYYEDMEADMSKKEQAFELLDQGLQNTDLVEKMGISRAAAYQYRYLYNLEKGEDCMSKNKVRAFNAIENGATKEDLVNELGITEAAAIRFIDKYNEERNGGEIEVVTNDFKNKAFELFDKAYTIAQVRNQLEISDGKAQQLRKQWIDSNKADLSTDEMADILAGEDATTVILRHKGVLPQKEDKTNDSNEKVKKHFVPREERERAEANRQEEAPEVKEEKAPVSTKNDQCLTEVKRPKLNKVVKVIEIQGEFTTYKPVGPNSFDMEIDGQIITLSREQMIDFGNELLAVAEEEI
nr:MAG TPA: transposase [Caudoviricetes sp.]